MRAATPKINLTDEQEIAIGEALGEELHFCGDEIAIELGIALREERDWLLKRSTLSELEDRKRQGLIAKLPNPDADPAILL
jgi:hypothetical protein